MATIGRVSVGLALEALAHATIEMFFPEDNYPDPSHHSPSIRK
jgi:hypothetical protein